MGGLSFVAKQETTQGAGTERVGSALTSCTSQAKPYRVQT